MAAAKTSAAVTPYGVNLINKHNAGCVAFGLVEQIAYTAGAYADEHLHKVRAADGIKGYLRFAGNRLGKQCLTSSRRAYQQNALGYPRT